MSEDSGLSCIHVGVGAHVGPSVIFMLKKEEDQKLGSMQMETLN